MKKAAIITIFAILPMLVLAPIHVSGAAPDRTLAARAAIHPVATQAEMQGWLKRVPQTRDYPPDFDATLKGQGTAFVIEMSTTPGCVPCGDLWSRLLALKSRYGLIVRTIGEPEAMLRSNDTARLISSIACIALRSLRARSASRSRVFFRLR